MRFPELLVQVDELERKVHETQQIVRHLEDQVVRFRAELRNKVAWAGLAPDSTVEGDD